jgi:hypothetical protein
MLIGQTLYAPNTDPGTTYYTPWFPRQGDAFTAVIEVLRDSGSFTLDVTVQTKNQESSDASLSSLGATYSITAVGTDTQLRSGSLELVRYRLVLAAAGSPQWIHLRINPPQWQPN